MNAAARQLVQRGNAWFLLVASAMGFANDIRGVFFGAGPIGDVVRMAPHSGIGFIEAHGLAFILGALLFANAPSRMWHATAAGIHLLLGASNLACWPIFAAADMLTVGYVTTALHALFFVLQSLAASGASPRLANA
jgi:hypothetical protein